MDPPVETHANGADPDALICRRCSAAFAKPIKAGRPPSYCSESCKKEARRSRIKGADTEPSTEWLS